MSPGLSTSVVTPLRGALAAFDGLRAGRIMEALAPTCPESPDIPGRFTLDNDTHFENRQSLT